MGNTNITIGVFEGQQLMMESRLATDSTKMEDQYAVELMDIFRLYAIDNQKFEGAIISSVVPPLETAIRRAVKKVTGTTPLMVGPGTKTGINIRIDNPAQLGADLLVGAVAAVAKYGFPCIIWDLGTATTVSVVDADGVFRGGAIMSGVGTSLNSLISRTSLLPRISLDAPPHAIGANTIESMQSGAVYGTASMLEGMCDRIEAELGYPATVIATGGLGKEITPHCRRKILYDNNLLLEGLRIIYEKNKK
jgi:type III pantothenate kinase